MPHKFNEKRKFTTDECKRDAKERAIVEKWKVGEIPARRGCDERCIYIQFFSERWMVKVLSKSIDQGFGVDCFQPSSIDGTEKGWCSKIWHRNPKYPDAATTIVKLT